jgi:hypothetical protein
MFSLTKWIKAWFWYNILNFSLRWNLFYFLSEANYLIILFIFFRKIWLIWHFFLLKLKWNTILRNTLLFLRFYHFNEVHYRFLFIVAGPWLHVNKLIFLRFLYRKSFADHLHCLYLHATNLSDTISEWADSGALFIK